MIVLSELGIIHTAISLVALAAGAIALASDKKIVRTNLVGKIYIITTALTAATALGIYKRGGFGVPHVLSILTLLLLLVAWLGAKRNEMLGKLTPYVVVVAYTATYLFHLVAGITETTTRLPVGAPWATSADDPHLKIVLGVVFLIFVLVASLQVLSLRATLQSKV